MLGFWQATAICKSWGNGFVSKMREERKRRRELLWRQKERQWGIEAELQWYPCPAKFPCCTVIPYFTFCVTSVRSDIFERLAWTSVMYRQSSFDLKNHFTVWLFKLQIVNHPSSSLWIVFSLLFFKIKLNKTPWENLPYPIRYLRENAYFLLTYTY